MRALQRPDLLALEQHLQRVAGLHQARDALRAAGAGKQPDLDLGQADAGRVGVRHDAVMAGERQLEGAAEADAVDRRGERLAAGLEPAVEQRQLARFLEEEAHRLLLALLLGEPRVVAPRPCSMVRSAPPEKLSLPEVMTQPLIAASAATALDDAASSSITSGVMTFIERPGMSQVASAMPSASMSKRKVQVERSHDRLLPSLRLRPAR